MFTSWFTVSGPGRAEAHVDPYGYWGCTQRTKTSISPLRVGFLPGDLPVNGNGDGVINSFTARLSDATSRLNAAMTNQGGQPYGASYVGLVPNSWALAVRVRSEVLPSGALGLATVNPSSCTVVHGAKVNLASLTVVSLATRSDWFVQDDFRRVLWESCPTSGYLPTYTCSKVYDAGSVMLHELGHAIGLAHPSQTQTHVSLSGVVDVMALAKCSVVLDQATMCQSGDAPGGGAYRSHRRTLDAWDTTSVSRAF